MFRATSDPGSPYYAVLMTTTKGVVVQWRTTQGGSTSQTSKVAGVPPLYLRIVRSANTFTAYTSPDGVAWTLVPGELPDDRPADQRPRRDGRHMPQHERARHRHLRHASACAAAR